jgi:hypothetical protein
VSGERIETDEPFSQMDQEQASEWARRDEAPDRPPTNLAEEAPEGDASPRRTPSEGRGDRPPRARPAAPAREQEPTGVPVALVAVVGLALLAGGGWLVLSMLRGGGETEAVVEKVVDPPVTIPDIPPELEPRMREVARLALTDWVVQVRDSLPVLRGIPAEPDAAWLGSRYLADAGEFPGVAEYWAMLDRYAGEILDREQDFFVAAYEARLIDSTAVAEPDPDDAVLVDRAGAGFLAGRPERRTVYRQLQAVIDAATDLHRFLVENQDRIDYEPHPEGDPVLEAVPETADLGDEMWDRVDGITAALDRLGALDKVTTERLLFLVTGKIEQIGVH